MDVMTLAIAGPSILALVLYWRNNPDRRLSWRRASRGRRRHRPGALPASEWAVAVLHEWGRQRRRGGSDSGGGSGGDGGGGSS
jgi:hypothetical protein